LADGKDLWQKLSPFFGAGNIKVILKITFGNIGVRFAMSKCMMQNSIKDVFGQTKDDLFYHFAL